VDVAGLPKNYGSNDPGPEELPKYTGPPEYMLDIMERVLCIVLFLPFPASTLLYLLFHGGAVNLGAGNAPGAMPLARNYVHQGSEEHLHDRLEMD
jgi:hypothetical protein